MSADDLPVDQAAQIALLEIVGAELLERGGRAHELRRDGEQQPGVTAAVPEVLEHVHERQRVVTEATPLLIERDAQDIGLADDLPLVAVEVLRGVVLDVARVERLEVLVEGLAKRLLLVGPLTGCCRKRHPKLP